MLISVDHVFFFLNPVIFIQTMFFTSIPLWSLLRLRFFQNVTSRVLPRALDKCFKVSHTPVVFILTAFFQVVPHEAFYK